MTSAAIIVCSGAKHLGIDSNIEYNHKLFTNGEIFVQTPNGGVNGKDVFIIQSFDLPNTHLMELLITIDACRRSNAENVHVIIPYFPYSRMDKRHYSGSPISAKVVAELLTTMHPTSIVSLDLHADQIQGFFNNNIRFRHVQMGAFFKHELLKKYPTFGDESWVFCSPDSGSVKRTKQFALLSNSQQLCNIIKYREKDQVVDKMMLIGDVNKKNVVIFDDMIDTGGTLHGAKQLLLKYGAKKVIALATHGIFSYPEKVHKNLDNYEIYVTNSMNCKALPVSTEVFSIGAFIYEIIYRISHNLNLGDMNSIWNY